MVTLRKTLQPNFPPKEFKKILPYDFTLPYFTLFPHKDFKKILLCIKISPQRF